MTQLLNSLGHTTRSGMRPIFPSRRAKISCRQWPGGKSRDKIIQANRNIKMNIVNKHTVDMLECILILLFANTREYIWKKRPISRFQWRWGSYLGGPTSLPGMPYRGRETLCPLHRERRGYPWISDPPRSPHWEWEAAQRCYSESAETIQVTVVLVAVMKHCSLPFT